MVRNRTVAVLALLVLAMFSPFAALAAISVGLDRNPVEVNESFQLVFTLDEAPDQDPDFSPLHEHFVILGNNRSSSISIVNGQYERSVKWTLQLMAKEAGEFEIPPVRFDDEQSTALKVTVKPASQSPLQRGQIALEMRADRGEAYVQSQVIVTLRLLSAVDLSAYQFGDISVGGIDTVVEPLGDVRQYQTRIANKAYLVLEKQFALFPQQTGRLDIKPVLAEVRLPSRRSFDPFRSGGEVRRLRSPAVSVEVLPVPEGFDAPYWLPAKRLELRQQWQGDLAALVAGEPVTRSISIVADGLTAAQLPELPLAAIDGIKQYPDQPVLENQRLSNGLRGSREQKVALIPGAAGSYRVPEISVPWWNLETGRLEIARLPAREIIVAAAAEAAPTPAQEEPSAAVEPVPATEAASDSADNGPGPWPWLSLALACGWGLSAFYWWQASRRRSSGVEPSTSDHGLREARRALQRACEADDAAAAREALLVWGRALLAPRSIANLHQLCIILGEPLTREVDKLNLSRYARSPEAWRGEELWRLCRELETATTAQRAVANSGLAPLNPA